MVLEKHPDRKPLNKTFFVDAKKYDVLNEALKIPYQFLVIGAVNDDIVPFSQVKEFTEKVKNSKLLTLPNSDHHLEEDWPLAEEAIRGWLRSKKDNLIPQFNPSWKDLS